VTANISSQYEVVFVHIPKNAGTAIGKALGMDKVLHHNWRHYEQNHSNVWNSYTKFAVVRNPWDRVVSNYAYAQMEKSYYHSKDGSTRYNVHPDYELLKDKSFEECIDILAQTDLTADRVSRPLKHHGWGYQYEYIYHGDDLKVDKVFHYEDLHYIDQWLDVHIPVINTSDRTDYRSYYTPKQVDIVAEKYAKDIELFGYTYD
jgi:hypothetical protein